MQTEKFSFTLVIPSLIGGLGIMFLSLYAGGLYFSMLDPNGKEVIPQMVTASVRLGFVLYQFIIVVLLVDIFLRKGVRLTPRAVLLYGVPFLMLPLLTYCFSQDIPHRFSLSLLLAIASLAVHQDLIPPHNAAGQVHADATIASFTTEG
ncbi:MAG: hypothetical protein WAV46_02905 [Candidatus Moraniibacteriota bacterium]